MIHCGPVASSASCRPRAADSLRRECRPHGRGLPIQDAEREDEECVTKERLS